MTSLECVKLKSPFPAFGGKSRVADEVWSRIGPEVRNFIEPFFFSGAVTLRRPGGAGAVETVNDRNAFVANFWRAVQRDPDAVAHHADWPVSEADLHARHRWLVGSDEATARMDLVREDPDAFDARIAGWWCWGACCWIGGGWCDESPQLPHLSNGQGVNQSQQLPHLSSGQGVNQSQQLPHLSSGRGVNQSQQLPHLSSGRGVNQSQKLPHLSNGQGVNQSQKLPHLDAAPRGINANVPDTGMPSIADAFSRGRGVNSSDEASTCKERRSFVTSWMRQLCDRLRPVRVCCGDWQRVCDSPSTMTRLGLTGVFLDPPYRKKLADGSSNRTAHIYASDKVQDIDALCDRVQDWCLRWGTDPQVRIALCGLDGEYPAIEAAGWEVWAWKSNGGYGNQSNGKNANAERERIWFSPACKKPKEPNGSLFA